MIKSKKILQMLLNLFAFVLIVDPTNTLFKIKDVVFVLLVISFFYNYKKINFFFFKILITTYLVVILTFLFGSIAGYEFEYSFTISVLKGFSPLILLLWIDKFQLINKIFFPSIVVSLIVIITFIYFIFDPLSIELFFQFYSNHDDTMALGMRNFLGFEIMSFFYKTTPVLIIPASIYTYYFFNKKVKKAKNFSIMLLISIALLLSGTRASMLAITTILGINFIIWLYKLKLGKFIAFPIFIISLISIIMLVNNLISDKDEKSNAIKFSYLEAYSDLIVSHPSILILGQGAGSKFYSKDRKEMKFQTEWSYIEIFRMFGLFGFFYVLFLFFFPLFLIFKYRNIFEDAFPMMLGYLLYLIVGGTNPLLLGSTGMIVLLVTYSFYYDKISKYKFDLNTQINYKKIYLM